MNEVSRRLVLSLFLTALLAAPVVQGGPVPHRLGEDTALNLLEHTLKHDRAYEGRISLNCVSYATEEKTSKYFEFVLRENHTGICGGDPETSPAVDRYRVYRASRKIQWLDPVEDKWQPYDPTRIRRR